MVQSSNGYRHSEHNADMKLGYITHSSTLFQIVYSLSTSWNSVEEVLQQLMVAFPQLDFLQKISWGPIMRSKPLLVI